MISAGSCENGAVDCWHNYAVAPSGCWEWQGYVGSNGYARLYDSERPKGQRVQWAHRAFYERHVGAIPDGMEIDHTCCVTACVNPAHLEPVTRPEHVRRTLTRLGTYDRHRLAAELRALRLTYAEIADALGYSGKEGAFDAVSSAIAKGLVDADSIPQAAPLTETECADICALYAFGVPQGEIAAWYGVDGSHVSRICNGKRVLKSREPAA